jgi:MFS family permease
MFILGMRLVFPALLPQIKAAYVLDNATAGATITAIWVAYSLVHFPAGLLVDRAGERSLMSGSILLAAGSIILIVTVDSFSLFFVAATLFGLGTGLYATPRSTVLSNVFGDHDGLAFGVTFAAGNVGAALLPFVAGAIAIQYGWKFGFAFALPVLVLVAIALWTSLPTSSLSLSGRSRSESKHEYAKSLYVMATRQDMLLTAGGIMLMTFTYQGFTSFYPAYLVEMKKLDSGVAATLFGVLFLSGAVAQPIAGTIADQVGSARTLAGIAVFGALTLATLPLVEGTLPLLVLSALLGTRLAVGPVNNAFIIELLPSEIQGSGYGLVRAVYLMVGSTGAFVVGSIADGFSFDIAFLFLAGVTVVAALLYIWLIPSNQHSAGR